MSTILITGGTGFVGRHLRKALEHEPVVLLSRSQPKLGTRERWSYMDLSDPVLPEVIEADSVICHLAYSMSDDQANVSYNRRLLEAVNSRREIGHVLVLSSTSVYGTALPATVDEESPCSPVGPYARSKLACEMIWREELRQDCRLTVLRPTEVIGIGGRGLISLVKAALCEPLVGTIKRCLLYHRRLHYVSVTNLVAAIKFCLERSWGSRHEAYVVSEDESPNNRSYAVMQDEVREVCGRRPLPGPGLPRPVLKMLSSATGRLALASEHTFSSRKIHEAGFDNVEPLAAEVRRIVESTKLCGGPGLGYGGRS